MTLSAAVILGSGFLPAEPRLVVWASFAAAWFGALLIVRRSQTVLSLGTSATDSLVERFGTFTIIVLGEVVLGVVAGLVSAERDGMTIAVGLLALCIGFGLWWTIPALFAAAVLLMENSRKGDQPDWMSQGS